MTAFSGWTWPLWVAIPTWALILANAVAQVLMWRRQRRTRRLMDITDAFLDHGVRTLVRQRNAAQVAAQAVVGAPRVPGAVSTDYGVSLAPELWAHLELIAAQPVSDEPPPRPELAPRRTRKGKRS